MRAEELKTKSDAELKQHLMDLLHEQFNLRMQQTGGQGPKPHLYKRVRRAIARVKTVMQAREGDKS
jgi:large subunit ribosomal protein L29